MSKYTAGTYTSTSRGVRGPITLEVTFDTEKIVSIHIKEHDEIYGHAYGLPSSPFENFIPEILKHQSLAVPQIVGTEVVCTAILDIVADCTKQAGGNPEELKKVPVPTPPKKSDSTIETDVVIFGSGVAGLSAAVEAKYCGADVVLVEKQGVIGGSSAICGGKIMAAGSKIQKKQGILDTPEMLFDFLKDAAGDYLNDARIHYFCQNANKNMEWLEEQGFQVQDVEAPHASMFPWRIHNSMGGGGQTMGWGGGFIVPLNNKFIEMGGKTLLNTGLTELIMENGKVVGAKAVDQLDGSIVTIKANAVILATGGYAANRAVVEARYPWMKNYYYNCPESSQGDGARVAEAVGARNYQHPFLQTMMLSMTCGAGVNEESGLIVTLDGKRFTNEYKFHSLVGADLAKTKSPGGYYITCGNEPFPTVNFGFSLDSTPKADSIEELAEMLHMEPSVLKSTVDRYNHLCEIGFDEDYGKPASELRPLKGPKYGAIFLMPATSITFGGLEIDLAAHVLDCEGNLIPGLYAAGEVANTGNFGHGVPACGYSIGHALHYGRVAARSATGKALL